MFGTTQTIICLLPSVRTSLVASWDLPATVICSLPATW